jgi:hypothetical protein
MIYRDSNDVLIIGVELGTTIIELKIGDPYSGGDLFYYGAHWRWIKHAYGFEPYHPYELEQIMNENRYKGQKLILFPDGKWEWMHEDFDINSICF